jgi:hypothetical protein
VRTFRFLTKDDIKTIAKTHDLSAPPSFRDDTARARLLNHCCNDDCRGSRYLLVFRRLAGKRRLNRTQFETPLPTTGVPSPRMLKILYSNEPGASQAGVIRSFTLNKFYRFICCGTAQELSSLKLADADKHIICSTSDVSRLVSIVLSLSVKDLRALSVAHNLPVFYRKPNLICSLMEHMCEDTCNSNALIFKQLAVPYSGEFTARVLPDSVPDSQPTLQSMEELDCLSMSLSNDIVVDPEDSVTFVSTYKLNRTII